MGIELNKINENFNKRLEEYKSRLKPKELKSIEDIFGVLYLFYINGFQDNVEEVIKNV